MSTTTRPKPTSMTVCDLCDSEIEREEEDRANLLVAVTPMGPATESTNHAGFWWPRRRTPQRDADEHPRRHLDFHGRCIARLVEANLHPNRKAPR